MKIGLTACGRCGEAHAEIKLKKFENPPPCATMWGTCPNTGDPILARIVTEDQ